MGLFKRSKKEEESNDFLVKKEEHDKQIESEIVDVKSKEDIHKEQAQNEINYLIKEVQNKTEEFNSVSQKLDSVKEEYDDVVRKLMLSKKEMHEQKKEFEELSIKIGIAKSNFASADAEISKKKSIVEDLQNANLELTSIRSQIAKYREEFEKLKSNPNDIQTKLNELRKKHVDADTELQRTKKILDSTKKELDILKIKSALGQKELVNVGKNKPSKNVIEAASAVVASINTKYFAAQKEIDALKQLLEKLREENNALNKKLEKSNS